MTKQQLLALWQGKSWERSPAGIYFISCKSDKDLHFSFSGYSEKDVKSIPTMNQQTQERTHNRMIYRKEMMFYKMDNKNNIVSDNEYP